MTSQIDFVILGLESAIEVLEARIRELRGESHTVYKAPKTPLEAPVKRGRKPGTIMSAAARERIRAAQVRRWKLVAEQKKRELRQTKQDEERMVSGDTAEAAETGAETAVAVGQTVSLPEAPEPQVESRPGPRRGRPAKKGSKGGGRGD